VLVVVDEADEPVAERVDEGLRLRLPLPGGGEGDVDDVGAFGRWRGWVTQRSFGVDTGAG
jgi:hypothetical protein